MNSVKVENINIETRKITVSFSVSGDDKWLSCFKEPYVDTVEYSDISLDGLPESVAVVPFICNVLPVAWLFDAVIYADEVDEVFLGCVPEFKKGFIDMYKDFSFGGRIEAGKTVHNEHGNGRSLVLFSGGVDAFYTAISHYDEKPILAPVWGADIYLDNENAWNNAFAPIKKASEDLELDCVLVKSSFRDYLSYDYLTAFVQKILPTAEWYHDFQHGPSLLSLTAPIAYSQGVGRVYIASSFCPELIGTYTCASDPTIDNHIRFASAQVYHDGFDSDRQEKIRGICDFCEKNGKKITLRVCWYSYNGDNCCECEKCLRTMLAIIVEGKNPADYGFPLYNEEYRSQMMYLMRKKFRIKYSLRRYYAMQKWLKKYYTYSECPDDLKWFYRLHLRQGVPGYYNVYKKLSLAVHKIIK